MVIVIEENPDRMTVIRPLPEFIRIGSQGLAAVGGSIGAVRSVEADIDLLVRDDLRIWPSVARLGDDQGDTVFAQQFGSRSLQPTGMPDLQGIMVSGVSFAQGAEENISLFFMKGDGGGQLDQYGPQVFFYGIEYFEEPGQGFPRVIELFHMRDVAAHFGAETKIIRDSGQPGFYR